ncbi:DUF3078 domain-containing protein [Aquimarina agarivorans]|uniref:DUF3078 domain-containing protein n=1 Tax=Aquimarina agarivorans TaxID=980584 RepID=UPI000248E641|nr:DUF3078 domain-containing protein [Aquimarina agarivorans]
MKKIILSISIIAISVSAFAQESKSEDELKKELGAKKASISALEGEAAAIQAKIDALPGWKKGVFGTIGGSIGGFDNWFTQASPNNSTGTIGLSINAFANLNKEKYFWRNSLNINLGWVKFDDKDDSTDDDSFQTSTDIFNISSLYGYKLSKTFAVSVLSEYRTAVLEGAFNDPGYLDIGVGGTWTPIKDLVVVIHPLNYNFVFSDGESMYESSLGAKVVADYTRKIGSVSFKTNLSAFLSYEDSDFSNWQWTNSLSYTLWKKIGVGFDFGLRSNKQEAFNAQLLTVADPETFKLENADNKLQSFWNLGLSYAF